VAREISACVANGEIKAAEGLHHSDDLVPLVPKERPAAEEPRAAREGSDFSAELQVTVPATPVSAHKFSNQFVRTGPPIGGRISCSLAYFSIAVLIGGGATFAWQSHGDDVKEMIRTRIPSLGRLLSVSTTIRPSDVATKPADPTATQDNSAALTQEELAQQLESDLERDEHSEEQVDAKQEQTTQDTATRQVQQNTKQAMPSPSSQDQSILAGPETTPTTIADWTLREVTNGTAVLQGPIGILRVTRGDTVPALGKVTSIVRWGNGWVVATSAGYCTSAPPNYVDGICKPYRGN
jgi:hypothetical protein